MEWRPSIVLKEAEANKVLTTLRRIGVNVRLEGEDRNKAIKVIESFLEQYKKCCWPILIIEIAGAIRRELLKSRNVIDVNMVSQVVDYLSNGGVEKKKKEKKGGSSDEQTDSDEEEEDDDEEENWKYQKDRYQGSDEEEEDLGFEDDSEEDEEEIKKVAAAKAAADAAAKKEIEDLHEPRRRKQCIEDLIRLSKEKGLSLKKGDEDEIFEMMIPDIRGWYYDDRMEIFLSRVREHIDRCSSLDNVDTIKTTLKTAIESDDFSFEGDHWKIIEQNDSNTTRKEEEDMADAKYQVNHSLNKAVVPTKEGVATPMNQIKQEENGDIMEFKKNRSPLNLPKPGKESAASAYSNIKESLDMVGDNKRKLAQI